MLPDIITPLSGDDGPPKPLRLPVGGEGMLPDMMTEPPDSVLRCVLGIAPALDASLAGGGEKAACSPPSRGDVCDILERVRLPAGRMVLVEYAGSAPMLCSVICQVCSSRASLPCSLEMLDAVVDAFIPLSAAGPAAGPPVRSAVLEDCGL